MKRFHIEASLAILFSQKILIFLRENKLIFLSKIFFWGNKNLLQKNGVVKLALNCKIF
jgi:hypothetical protein